MIVPVREKAGLGCPPEHFTTNANESMNKVIKQALHYEEKNWDKFCEEMLSLVKMQYQELEKCVVRSGEYRFRPQFAYLEISLSTWNRMSVKQREQHMKSVHCASMQPDISAHKASAGSGSSEAGPSKYFDSTPAPGIIPKDTWDRCLQKVNTLLNNPESMSSVPGGNNRSRYVASTRSPDSPIKVQAVSLLGSTVVTRRNVQRLLVMAFVLISLQLQFVMATTMHSLKNTIMQLKGHVLLMLQ